MDSRLEGLFNFHSQMVFRICLRYVASRDEAEDLTQEVFLKLGRNLRGFQGESEIGTWIYRIAVNVCLDYLRTMKRRTQLFANHIEDIVVRNFNSGGDRELAKIDLERLLDQASPDVREFLFLTQLEGVSFQDAAKITGKSVVAISKSVSRFKKSTPMKIRIQELRQLEQKSPRRAD